MHTVGFCGLCSAPDTEANLQVFLLHAYTYRLCTIDQFTKAQNHLYITCCRLYHPVLPQKHVKFSAFSTAELPEKELAELQLSLFRLYGRNKEYFHLWFLLKAFFASTPP